MYKYFFIVRVTEHWHRLSREVGESPFLEIFKTNLDIVPGTWLWGHYCSSGERQDDLLPDVSYYLNSSMVMWCTQDI